MRDPVGLTAAGLLVAASVWAASGGALPWAIGLGVVAWLLGLRGLDQRRAGLVLLVAALARAPFLGSEFHSNDLHRYLFEGRAGLEGVSPFATPPADPSLFGLRDASFSRIPHPELATVYPPAAQALFRTAAWLGLDESGLRNLILVLDLAVVATLLGWLRSTGRPPARAALYAWAPLAIASAAAGHVDPLMLIFLVGFAWAWEKGRGAWAAAALAGAILAKTVAVVLVPWLLIRHPRRVLAVTLPLVAAGYSPYLAQGHLEGALGTFATKFAFNAPAFSALEAIDPTSAPIVALALSALGLTSIALVQPRVASAWALSLAGLLLVAPTVHYWYLTWFLAPLAAVGLRPWTWPLLAWSITIAFLVPVYGGAVVDAPVAATPWVAMEYGVPGVLAAAVLWRSSRRRALARGGTGPAGSVAVVIPACREVESLSELLPRFATARVDRVVVVDLPSGDGTESLCRVAPRVEYVAQRQPGYGAAVRSGLAAARDADFVVVCDADHLRAPEQLEALLAPFSDPRIGLVTAARSLASPLTWLQRLGNRLVTWLIALGWGRRFHDLGPLRALRVSTWRRIPMRDDGFGWNVEMNVRALQADIGVVEVGLDSGHRRHGRNRITGTLGGSVSAGAGMLLRLYRLRLAP